MAIQNVQVNIADAMQKVALDVERNFELMTRLSAMWNTEGMAALTDADIQSLPTFAHVTAAELLAAKNGMDTLITAWGAYAANTPSIRLLRIVNNI
jgi:hypothetical protein